MRFGSGPAVDAGARLELMTLDTIAVDVGAEAGLEGRVGGAEDDGCVSAESAAAELADISGATEPGVAATVGPGPAGAWAAGWLADWVSSTTATMIATTDTAAPTASNRPRRSGLGDAAIGDPGLDGPLPLPLD